MAKKGKPVKEFMGEFITANPNLKDYTSAFEEYKTTNNPQGSKGLFMFMWNKLNGTCRVKKTPIEKSASFLEGLHGLQSLCDIANQECSKIHIEGLLTNDLEKKKELKQKEEQAIDALFAANRKVRNYLEALQNPAII